jgi:hypothetical protein
LDTKIVLGVEWLNIELMMARELSMNTFGGSADQETMHITIAPITTTQRHRMHNQKLDASAILARYTILGPSSDIHDIIIVYTNTDMNEVVPNARAGVTEQPRRPL